MKITSVNIMQAGDVISTERMDVLVSSFQVGVGVPFCDQNGRQIGKIVRLHRMGDFLFADVVGADRLIDELDAPRTGSSISVSVPIALLNGGMLPGNSIREVRYLRPERPIFAFLAGGSEPDSESPPRPIVTDAELRDGMTQMMQRSMLKSAGLPPDASDEDLWRLCSSLREEIDSHVQAVIDEGDGCEVAPDVPTIHCRREDEECKPYRSQF